MPEARRQTDGGYGMSVKSVVTTLSLLISFIYAQTETRTAFEAASVRPSTSGPLKMESDPVRFYAKAQAADALIRVAFGLREYEYSGPPWLHTARYDIVATTSSPHTRAEQL